MASTKNGIIYPDNYDKVADVPADMKVLAESVDGNIERINKNLDKNADELKNLQKDNTGNKTAIEAINKKNTKQDTNIQKNAKDIEANQNNIKALQVKNAEVKAENERLRSDIESISLVGEAEGESIDLDDSSGARFKKFGVSGNHSQETIKNIQTELLNAVITGGTTLSASNLGKVAEFECKANTQYTIKRNVSTSRFKAFESSEKWDRNSTIKTLKNEKELSESDNTYTTTESAKYVYVFCWFSTGGDTSSNIPAITSSTECPSLNYPSEIKTVKDNINLTVAKKNYINIENTSKTINGITFTVNSDGSILANGTATARVSYPIQNNFKKFEAGQYFVSGCPSGGSEATYYLILWNENWVSMGSEYGKGRLVSLSNQKVKLHINIMQGTVCNNLLFKPQMEKGTKATDYEAHQEQAITMPVQQEMLKEDYFGWVNEKEVHRWNLLSFTGNEAWSLLSGATSVFLLGNVSGQTYGGHNFSMCTHFKYDTRVGGMANLQDETFAMQYEYSALYVKCNKFTTVEEWKAYLKSQYENGTPIKLAYITANITELSFTDEQKAVAKKIKETLHTYKNITHIYSTDKTSPIMNVEYAKDLNTQNNNLQNQIDEIKQLLSTTQTSAMLIDNLQKEVESEVE